MAPIYFDEFLASEEARRETWRRRFAMEDIFKAAEPNRGHRAVDALVRRGKVAAVITQNIDGLHEASGVPRDKIIELHGNTTYATCLDCGQRYEIADLRAASSATGRCRLRQMPRPRQRRDGLVRQSMRCWRCNARAGTLAAICSSCSALRWWSIRRPGSAAAKAQRRGAGHRQSRADRARPDRRSRAARPDRRHDGRAVG